MEIQSGCRYRYIAGVHNSGVSERFHCTPYCNYIGLMELSLILLACSPSPVQVTIMAIILSINIIRLEIKFWYYMYSFWNYLDQSRTVLRWGTRICLDNTFTNGYMRKGT